MRKVVSVLLSVLSFSLLMSCGDQEKQNNTREVDKKLLQAAAYIVAGYRALSDGPTYPATIFGGITETVSVGKEPRDISVKLETKLARATLVATIYNYSNAENAQSNSKCRFSVKITEKRDANRVNTYDYDLDLYKATLIKPTLKHDTLYQYEVRPSALGSGITEVGLLGKNKLDKIGVYYIQEEENKYIFVKDVLTEYCQSTVSD